MHTSERRKNARTPTNIVVEFSEGSSETIDCQPQEGTIGNYSLGGMYILTDHPLSRGKTIRLTFHLNSQSNNPLPIQIHGIVRWIRKDTNPQCMGIEFLNFEGIDEHDFTAWISNLL